MSCWSYNIFSLFYRVLIMERYPRIPCENFALLAKYDLKRLKEILNPYLSLRKNCADDVRKTKKILKKLQHDLTSAQCNALCVLASQTTHEAMVMMKLICQLGVNPYQQVSVFMNMDINPAAEVLLLPRKISLSVAAQLHPDECKP